MYKGIERHAKADRLLLKILGPYTERYEVIWEIRYYFEIEPKDIYIREVMETFSGAQDRIKNHAVRTASKMSSSYGGEIEVFIAIDLYDSYAEGGMIFLRNKEEMESVMFRADFNTNLLVFEETQLY